MIHLEDTSTSTKMPPARSSAATRACDSCRRRKVKCDATETCANCRISQLHCQYTSAPKKRGPKGAIASGAARERTQITQGAGCQILSNDGPFVDENQDDPDRLWMSPVSLTENHEPTGESVDGTEEDNSSPQTRSISDNIVPHVAEVDLVPVPTSEWAQTVRDGLLVLMGLALPAVPALDAVNTCIDLYMQYTFPTAPMVHEPTLRVNASRFFTSTLTTDLFEAQSRQEEVAHMQAFALLAALCASVASVMPESLLPYRNILARPCLDASREMLKSIEDFDVEYPNSTSIATRVFHATALQQITGKTALSHYVLGQATLLIRNMRLHSEEALKDHDPLEARLLRSIFWQIYAADKASACLGSRPCLLHELLFDGEPTLRPNSEPHIPLLDTTSPWWEGIFEERLFIGFHFLPRLWSSAASLLFDLRAHAKGTQETKETNRTRLTEAYMEFLGILDGLPYWLQTANLIITRDDGEAAQFQKTSFWVQRCTVLVTFQCLRLVILQQCIDSKVWDVMGLNDQAMTLPMAKISIVHDFVKTLDDIPFLYIQVKGEPTVERIRRVGSYLLEIINNVNNDTITVRAEHYFTRLLDLLAMLDSKSSEVLAEMKQQSRGTRRD